MLDVHVLLSPDTRADWQRECLTSVHEAIKNAGYPVDIHEVAGVPGHIGRARAAGYALGVHPYVTYVDCDDYLLPHAFASLADDLATGPDAIFPAETTLQNGKFRDGPQRHHLCVYRRAQLIDHSAWVVCGDLAQMMAAGRAARVLDVAGRAYVHRLYQSGGRALRRQHHDELRRARG